jgi:hypothetical protein
MLRGEFRLSFFELVPVQIASVVSIAFAAMMFRLSFGKNGVLPTGDEKLALISVGAIFLIGVSCLAYYFMARYIFDGGTLRVMLPGGYEYGRYDLQALQSVTRMKGRGVDFLILRWENQKRKIMLPRSLFSALGAADGI